MRPHTLPQIVDAEGVSDGVIVLFADGVCALYPVSLLRDTLYRAKEIVDFGDQPEDE